MSRYENNAELPVVMDPNTLKADTVPSTDLLNKLFERSSVHMFQSHTKETDKGLFLLFYSRHIFLNQEFLIGYALRARNYIKAERIRNSDAGL